MILSVADVDQVALGQPAQATEAQQASTAILKNLDDSHKKNDVCMLRYEKALDMSIEATRENKTRFPMTLFGFVITTTLLVGWLTMAATPLFNQIKIMAKPLAMGACEMIVHSDAVTKAQGFIDQGTSAVNGALDDMSNGTAKDLTFSVGNLIDEAICKPMVKTAEAAAAKAVEKAQGQIDSLNASSAGSDADTTSSDSASESDDGDTNSNSTVRRRLGELPPLAPLLEDWWEETPGDPATKLFVVHVEMADLRRRAMQLLKRGPAEVLAAHRQRGWTAAVETVLQESKWKSPQEDWYASGTELNLEL